MVAAADFSGSALLVAVTVHSPGSHGASKVTLLPLPETSPQLASHVTDVFSVPVTVAVSAWCAPMLNTAVPGSSETTTGGGSFTVMVAAADLV